MNYHILSINETQQLLTTGKDGLNQAVAEERLLENGKNELVEKKKKPFWILFLNQFKDLMIIILLGAATIYIVLGDLKDAGVTSQLRDFFVDSGPSRRLVGRN